MTNGPELPDDEEEFEEINTDWDYDIERSDLDPYREGFDEYDDTECDLIREDWRD